MIIIFFFFIIIIIIIITIITTPRLSPHHQMKEFQDELQRGIQERERRGESFAAVRETYAAFKRQQEKV
jgi:hypothetical protein